MSHRTASVGGGDVPMRILIANDDGIYSPGILALAETASRFGDVRIVAPDVEQSSAGHAITGWRPLTYKRTPIKSLEAFRVNGTPSDCGVLGVYNWELVKVIMPVDNMKQVSWSRHWVRHYDGKIVPGEDPMGRKLFWFSVVPIEGTEEGTDRWAVEQGYVSITPLRVDLTNEKELADA